MIVEVGLLSVGDKFVLYGRRYRVDFVGSSHVEASSVGLLGTEIEIDLEKSQFVLVEV